MIISFSVENFLSFKEEIHFSMIANGRERQHRERVPNLKNYNKKVLPVSLLYGGNASGKSNFVEAIDFAKNYIILGSSKDQNIQVKPFRLSKEKSKKPSKFIFQLLIEKNIYEYGFELTSKEVKCEWLTKIGKNTNHTMYKREKNNFDFNYSAWKIFDDSPKQYLNFLAEGTLTNKLFLSNVKDLRMEEHKELRLLESIYNWFNNIIIIKPFADFLFNKAHLSNKSMISFLSNMLKQLDTGVTSFNIKEIPLPQNMLEMLDGSINVNKFIELDLDISSLYFFKDEKGKTLALKKSTQHFDESGNPVEFSLEEESDGTTRLINLLPAFYWLCNKDTQRVFIIDEFNRSLHPLLTQKLLNAYLSCCNENSRSQLIFTSHDVMLLDQNIFRRDEIWFAERNKQGASKLSSLSDFKNLRKDKKLRNSYLMGRFDGIPDIFLPFDFMLSTSNEVVQNKEGD